MFATSASQAMAQAGSGAAPDQVKWVPFVVAVALTACIILVSVMRSKRSHRD